MRVLIIEDEHKIARALKKALEQESYAVDISYDGTDGHAMAMTEPYDVAIIDRMIPGDYDGLAIVKAMRSANMKSRKPFCWSSVTGSSTETPSTSSTSSRLPSRRSSGGSSGHPSPSPISNASTP